MRVLHRFRHEAGHEGACRILYGRHRHLPRPVLFWHSATGGEIRILLYERTEIKEICHI